MTPKYFAWLTGLALRRDRAISSRHGEEAMVIWYRLMARRQRRTRRHRRTTIDCVHARQGLRRGSARALTRDFIRMGPRPPHPMVFHCLRALSREQRSEDRGIGIRQRQQGSKTKIKRSSRNFFD